MLFKGVGPVKRIEIYKHSLVLEREVTNTVEMERGRRGEVRALSKSSLSRLAFIASNTGVRFRSIMTLTYGVNFPLSGRRVKKDLNKFLTYTQRTWQKYDYLWFLEFQRRGAPHFHILVSMEIPKAFESKLRCEMAHIWSKIAEPEDIVYSNIQSRKTRSSQLATYRVHTHIKAWEPIRKEDGAARYAIKYATKSYQKNVPENYRSVGRFWGASRKVKETVAPIDAIDVGSEDEAKRYVEFIGRQDLGDWEFLPKIVFCSRTTPF